MSHKLCIAPYHADTVLLENSGPWFSVFLRTDPNDDTKSVVARVCRYTAVRTPLEGAPLSSRAPRTSDRTGNARERATDRPAPESEAVNANGPRTVPVRPTRYGVADGAGVQRRTPASTPVKPIRPSLPSPPSRTRPSVRLRVHGRRLPRRPLIGSPRRPRAARGTGCG